MFGRNVELLRRIRSAVSPGARLLAVDFWTDRDQIEPLFAALMAGEFLVMQGGDVFSEEEAKEWLAERGWKYVETLPLSGPAQDPGRRGWLRPPDAPPHRRPPK